MANIYMCKYVLMFVLCENKEIRRRIGSNSMKPLQLRNKINDQSWSEQTK